MDFEAVRKMKQQHLQTLMGIAERGGRRYWIQGNEGRADRRAGRHRVRSRENSLPKRSLPAQLIPQQLGGIRTDVQALGVIKALQSPTGKMRPAPGGCSIGHVDVTAGTLGMPGLSRIGGVHPQQQPRAGQLQPRAALVTPSCSRVRQTVAQRATRLPSWSEFVPIDFVAEQPQPTPTPGGCSVSNAARAACTRPRSEPHQCHGCGGAGGWRQRRGRALARPLSPNLVENRILNIGQPHGTATATLNTQVVKSGRSSGFTTGQIRQIDVTVQVEYEDAGTATFSGQLVATGDEPTGDSGRRSSTSIPAWWACCSPAPNAATMINPIQNVMAALNVTIPG